MPCTQIRKMKLQGRENKIAVVVGTITDDVRILNIPKLKVSVNDVMWFCSQLCTLYHCNGSFSVTWYWVSLLICVFICFWRVMLIGVLFCHCLRHLNTLDCYKKKKKCQISSFVVFLYYLIIYLFILKMYKLNIWKYVFIPISGCLKNVFVAFLLLWMYMGQIMDVSWGWNKMSGGIVLGHVMLSSLLWVTVM